MPHRPVHFLSNIEALDRQVFGPLAFSYHRDWNLWHCLASPGRLMAMLHQDGVLLAVPTVAAMALAALLKVLSLGRLRLYYYDILITPPPLNLRGRLREWVRRLALRHVERVLLVHRDVETYSHRLGLPADRFEFVGFKANNYERIAENERRPRPEGDYILACGQSFRDYPTFVRALELCGLPGRIVLPPGTGRMEAHSGVAPDGVLPPNVQVEHHDGTTASWDALMLGARVVTIPLRRDTVQPAGISVCFEAMSLGKAVVLTEGPLTRAGDITAEQAVIVPPGDAESLAEALRRIWNDDETRERVASAGLDLAQRFGGTEAMCRALASALTAHLITDERAQSSS